VGPATDAGFCNQDDECGGERYAFLLVGESVRALNNGDRCPIDTGIAGPIIVPVLTDSFITRLRHTSGLDTDRCVDSCLCVKSEE